MNLIAVPLGCDDWFWPLTKDVHAGEHITRNEAYDLLTKDLVQTQEELATIVKVPVTENQFIALMSWLFNLWFDARRQKINITKKTKRGRL